MPIYDYRCDHCGHAFSAVQSFKDNEPLAACPRCGKRPRRLITTPAIVFKGSGWYKTDSRASSAAAKESAAKDAPAKDVPAAKDGASSTSEGADRKAAPAKAADGSAAGSG